MTDARPAALITGSARRLGRAIALALAESGGYDIAVHCHTSLTAGEETAAAIRAAGARAAVLSGDLTDTDAADALVRDAQDRFPSLDVLVNSASRYDQATLRDTSAAVFDAQMAINLRAPFFLTQAFARRVGRGHVINIADNKVAFNQHAYAAYLLSKKALVELTRLAAIELAPEIRVNAVAPGVVLPNEARTAEYLAWRVEGIPLRRQGDPSDVTAAVLYLLQNRFVTGQVLFVDGGESVAFDGRHAANAPPRRDP